ncbi:hypothetical protein QTP70_027436, partial [Hemibagrus guttatus]
KQDNVHFCYKHTHIHCLPLIRTTLGSWGACAYLRRHRASRQDTPWTECQPIAGHTHSHSLKQSYTTDNFRDANQNTMHVFGLGEEDGVPGGNPRGTGRTCKLHTHGGGGNQTPNPGVYQSCGFKAYSQHDATTNVLQCVDGVLKMVRILDDFHRI